MAKSRRRRNKTTRRVITIAALLIVAGLGWRYWPSGSAPEKAQPTSAQVADNTAGEADGTDEPVTATTTNGVPVAVVSENPPTVVREPVTRDEPLVPVGPAAQAAPADDGQRSAVVQQPPAGQQAPVTKPAGPVAGGEKLSANPRINASLERFKAGQVIAARQELNRMLAISRDEAEQAELRKHLRKIADITIFSKQFFADDPLIERYTIEPGDVLVSIGRRYRVPHEAIMLINGIKDARRIRAGQTLKVPRGPFNAVIHKRAFRLDVYLGDLYLRSFPVGLGADQGTPEGKWVVKDRLTNPTYYPPASASEKRIIPPDDPTNPLGEYWIGLEGVSGDALGREGYGIHGTIDPGSIGKAVSMGCVRMHNDDVAFLYKLMMPGHSTVTILP